MHTEFSAFQFHKCDKQNTDFHGESILSMFLTNLKHILKMLAFLSSTGVLSVLSFSEYPISEIYLI